jgi:uncharacterized membrane protein YebE (DUF533 family)
MTSMIDPTRLLGGLLRGSMGRGITHEAGIAVGMGAVGVAVAAFEHFMAQRQAAVQPQAPPPLPGTAVSPARAAVPPPLPPVAPLPPPPVVPVSPASDPHRETLLLVRAMVAAAWADGRLDDAERSAIVQRLATAGLDEDEQLLMADELSRPLQPEALAAQAAGPELAEQVYTVSVLAIRVDSPAERAYLQRLAGGLGLDTAAVARIHRMLGQPV